MRSRCEITRGIYLNGLCATWTVEVEARELRIKGEVLTFIVSTRGI